MASIVLSFVGNQDPVSDNTREEGSIVTLIHHLLKENQDIRQVILLHTEETKERANLTEEWLKDEPLNIAQEKITLITVDSQLSNDPINLLAAVREARRGIDFAQQYLQSGDKLELNASSGTPVMKSSWSILQAAGYAPNSTVWQVRNPQKIQEEQERIVPTNVDVLKNEFDIKVIKKQIDNYNYSGALVSLRESNLNTNILEGLLEYGDSRLAFNFNKAFDKINNLKENLDGTLWQDISNLRRRESTALLKEAYYKVQVSLKQRKYSDALIWVFAFQENLLQYLTKKRLLNARFLDKPWKDMEQDLRKSIENYEGGELKKHLESRQLKLDWAINRPIMKAILEYDSSFSRLIPLVNQLESYGSQRNEYIHDLRGVAGIDNSSEILKNLREILQIVSPLPKANPFELLNETICSLLDTKLRGECQ